MVDPLGAPRHPDGEGEGTARTPLVQEQTLAHGWSRDILALQIQASAHARHGRSTSNFSALLPPPQSELTQQALKDPYIFDFLTLTHRFQERDLETQLVSHLEKFLIELGQGFAFLGRQYRLDVGSEDFYVDLLFYHVGLRALNPGWRVTISGNSRVTFRFVEGAAPVI